ncbi:MAG: beta-galactosidase [bacterium]
MDVNDSKFHLLLNRDDWLGRNDNAFSDTNTDLPRGADLSWDEEWNALSLQPLLFIFPTPPDDRLYNPEDRRGAGRDRYGTWYWIDENRTEIRFLTAMDKSSKHFWSAEDQTIPLKKEKEPGDFQPVPQTQSPVSLEFSGLALTEDHYLVVGVQDPGGLLIFDLHAGGPPAYIFWPLKIPFAPYDIAPAPGGGVWVLDREEARYWALDQYFRPIDANHGKESPGPGDFRSATSSMPDMEGRSFSTGISIDMALFINAFNPRAIEALPDGTVLILDIDQNGHSIVYRYRLDLQLGTGADLDDITRDFFEEIPDSFNPYAIKGHDMAFVPASDFNTKHVAGTLYIVTSDGNQAFAFDLKADDKNLTLSVLPGYFPMRHFSGKALITSDNDVFYDLQNRWIPLKEKPKPRYKSNGFLETRIFDGKETDCVWHRMFTDGFIPSGTGIKVESRSSNDPDMCLRMPWQPEPNLYRRCNGIELPYSHTFSEEEVKMDGAGTWELLLQNVQGRYMQLRLTLEGTGKSTPRLRALRVYYPRFSYLKEYLPVVYQEDKTSASFLERFLANTEGLYTVLESKIEQAQTLFDIKTTAAEYLNWLAEWIGAVLDPAWDEERRRFFLSHAMELFNQRGTLTGLIRAIRLATDPCPDNMLFSEDILDGIFRAKGICNSFQCTFRYPVYIIEGFLTRTSQAMIYKDPDQTETPGITSDQEEWNPEMGASTLHNRYQKYLKKKYTDIKDLNKAWEKETDYNQFEEILFSPVKPSNANEAKDWKGFFKTGTVFNYTAVNPSYYPDLISYRAFLERRYRQINQLNKVYQLTGEHALASFEEIEFPGEDDMPSGGYRLYDWIHFVLLVLPIKRRAHRFTVLFPIDIKSTPEERKQGLDLIRHIVELEKPAHVTFEVKPYWALFRVGWARLGLDTIVGEGSRFVALCLGRDYMGDGYVTSFHPWNIPNRIVVDRDHIDSGMIL